MRRHLRPGPSGHPDLAEWLVGQGISAVSPNPDTVVAIWLRLAERAGAGVRLLDVRDPVAV